MAPYARFMSNLLNVEIAGNRTRRIVRRAPYLGFTRLTIKLGTAHCISKLMLNVTGAVRFPGKLNKAKSVTEWIREGDAF